MVLRQNESCVGEEAAGLRNLKMDSEVKTFSPSDKKSNLSAQPFSARSHDEQLRCLEILSSIDTTAAHGGHDHVPTEGDRVLVLPDSVVLGQAVLQEPLRTQF